MFCQGQCGGESGRIAFCLVRCDPCWCDATPLDGFLKERARSGRIAPVAQVDINDVPMLVDGAEQIAPAAAKLEMRFTTRHRSPTEGRYVRAAAMKCGVKVCTQS